MSQEYLDFVQRTTDEVVKVAHSVAPKHVGEIVSIIDCNNGESSSVYRIEGVKRTCILKFSRYSSVLDTESYALSEWSNLGIKTPQIYELGMNYKIPYLLMECIEYPRLDQVNLTLAELEEAICILGKSMKVIHGIEVRGFGSVSFGIKDLVAQFQSLRGYIYPKLSKSIEELRERNLWEIKLENGLAWSISILEEISRKTVLVHDDLLPYNCFYDVSTKTIVLFDPNPQGSLAILDIAKTYLKLAVKYDAEVAQYFLRGYGLSSEVTEDYLRAAIIVRGITQLSTWAKKGKLNKIPKAIETMFHSSFSGVDI